MLFNFNQMLFYFDLPLASQKQSKSNLLCFYRPASLDDWLDILFQFVISYIQIFDPQSPPVKLYLRLVDI